MIEIILYYNQINNLEELEKNIDSALISLKDDIIYTRDILEEDKIIKLYLNHIKQKLIKNNQENLKQLLCKDPIIDIDINYLTSLQEEKSRYNNNNNMKGTGSCNNRNNISLTDDNSQSHDKQNNQLNNQNNKKQKPQLSESQLLQQFKDKITKLEDNGINPYSYKFDNRTEILSILEENKGLKAEETTGKIVNIAGRVSFKRGQGKIMFAGISDMTGTIQVQTDFNTLGDEHKLLTKTLVQGDILGVTGEIISSKTGELTIKVNKYEFLSKASRPLPDKHEGLVDTEKRYRQRELDMIANPEVLQRFIKRSKSITSVRSYLDSSGFIEVETPILQSVYGGATASPFVTHHNSLDQKMYMRIAPELYLKRCLVGGIEKVYELGKDFRNEGLSPRHNPEFTMLEWYEAYTDYKTAASRVEEMVRDLSRNFSDGALDTKNPWKWERMDQAILDRTGIDILKYNDSESLKAAIKEKGLKLDDSQKEWSHLVDDLAGDYVEPTLIEPTFLYGQPRELSPFAKPDKEDSRLTERFELIVQGKEIANAFSELNDPRIQKAQLEELDKRKERGDAEAPPYDPLFIEALEYGMPPASGVGIGIDRLFMLLGNQKAIKDVILFPTLKNK